MKKEKHNRIYKKIVPTLLSICLICSAFPQTVLNGNAAGVNEKKVLYGNQVRITYDSGSDRFSIEKGVEDGQWEDMGYGIPGYPIIQGEKVKDFEFVSAREETGVSGRAGSGNRLTVTSRSSSTGLSRVSVIETSDAVPGLLYLTSSYTAKGENKTISKSCDGEFYLTNHEDTVWSYNGGGEGSQSYYDTLQEIRFSDDSTFYRENRQDQTAAAIPAADIYSRQGGIVLGDASTSRRELTTPVSEVGNEASVSLFRPGTTLKAGETYESGQMFVNVHDGDYYNGLRAYRQAMELIGFSVLSKDKIPQTSYDLRWETWGWEFEWDVARVLQKLEQLKSIGVTQVTLDDGWYNSAGEWGLNDEKFPGGSSDMRRITDAIHEKGMTAILWWRPCDGGRENSKLFQEHPEYFIKNKDGSYGKVAGPGHFNEFLGSAGYALCPLQEGAVQSQVDFIHKAMQEWGFDGFKSDYVWSLPNCYRADHHHLSPSESTNEQERFYKEIYEAIISNNKDGFHLLCNCGAPQDFYSLPYVTQIPTADPTSVDQTRRRVKAYKALCGDYFPVTTDHNEIWYPSTIGTGAVMAEKREFEYDNYREEEYERWLKIAQETNLQKGNFIGDLYSYGYDPYETYVVEKDGTMYYAFYNDGTKYRPQGTPDIELKGLDPNKRYRVVDYVNNRVVVESLSGSSAIFPADFQDYLLVRAEELSGADVGMPSEPGDIEGFLKVENNSESLEYKGEWFSDNQDVFSDGNASYTNTKNAEVTLNFEGSKVAWYGQKDFNFGTAQVYVDDIWTGTVDCRGSNMSVQVKLFESKMLEGKKHTLKIVCENPVIDIDCFMILNQKEEPPETEEPSETNPPETEEPSETNPPETEKPTETNPPETEKPTETNPPETEKPTETNPPETEKPTETNPPETEKPTETNPPETEKPTETNPPETEKPTETNPPQTDEPKPVPGKKPIQVKQVKANPSSSYIKVSWKKQTDAKTYRIFLYSKGKWKSAGETPKTNLTIKKRSSGTSYYVRVAAVNKAGQGRYSSRVKVVTLPEKVKIKTVRTGGKNKVKLSYHKVKAAGYEIWLRSGKSKFKKAATTGKTQMTLSKLKKGVQCDIKVRAYVKNGNKKQYGTFSEPKKYKVR